MADKLVELADEDAAAARTVSAGTKRLRASLYYLIAERMQRPHLASRKRVYAQALSAFAQGAAEAGHSASRIEIGYGPAHISGLFVPAQANGPVPCVIHVNSLDSTKELLYFDGLAQALARRGVASLLIDQPGTGEALRLHAKPATAQSERWASPVLDYLLTRSDVIPSQIGIAGVSLGGYYAPRAVAFEPRFAVGAVWGANHDWGEVQLKRLAREGDRPVPHYWEHVNWVWGTPDTAAFMAVAKTVTLDGILDRVRVPFLVTHGEGDRQINVSYANETFAALHEPDWRQLRLPSRSRRGGGPPVAGSAGCR